MVEIAEGVKIKDLGEQQQSQIKQLIYSLFMLMGIEEKEDGEKKLIYFALDRFICVYLKKYTVLEISNAMMLYLSGQFSATLGKTVYRKLDAVILGAVMQEYELYKREELKRYDIYVHKNAPLQLNKQNELTSSEKKEVAIKGVSEAFEFFKKNKSLGSGRVYVFDILYRAGLLDLNPKYVEDVRKRALEKDINQAQNKIRKKSELQKALKIIEEKQNNPKNITARYISIEDYFKKIIEEKKDILKILKEAL